MAAEVWEEIVPPVTDQYAKVSLFSGAVWHYGRGRTRIARRITAELLLSSRSRPPQSSVFVNGFGAIGPCRKRRY